MPIIRKFSEFVFIDELKEALKKKFGDTINIEETGYDPHKPDLTITYLYHKILIEIKYSHKYESLPISTLTQLKSYLSDIVGSGLILVSFSRIDSMMMTKLKDLKITTLLKPKTNDVILEVEKLIQKYKKD